MSPMRDSQSLKYPVIVPGVGPVPAPGMIIGEAPGRNEIEQGQPFVGRSGILLNQTLELLNTGRERFYITNIFKGDVGDGNRNPTFDEMGDHRPLLEQEILDVNPTGILLLGSFACEYFGLIGRMGDMTGNEYEVQGRRVFPCYHPAYVLRQRGHTTTRFVQAVGRFVERVRDQG